MADSKLYKHAGNSVCVLIIERIARDIYRAMEIANAFAGDRCEGVDIGWLERYARDLEPERRDVIIEMLNQWRAR